jgi:2-hydroxychromene-2-carboxylate isomerase
LEAHYPSARTSDCFAFIRIFVRGRAGLLDSEAAEPFVLETWRKLFAEEAQIGSIDALTRGLDARLHPEIRQGDSQAAEDLEIANRDAVASGCFGVPWIVADDEPHFGQDRLYLLDRRWARADRRRVSDRQRRASCSAWAAA